MGYNGSVNVPARVLEIESPLRDHIYTITFKDGSSLKLTKEHPLFTNSGWKSLSPVHTSNENAALSVELLKVGDKVLNSSGKYVKIIGISFKHGQIRTFNLKSVSDYNNFYAGSQFGNS